MIAAAVTVVPVVKRFPTIQEICHRYHSERKNERGSLINWNGPIVNGLQRMFIHEKNSDLRAMKTVQ